MIKDIIYNSLYGEIILLFIILGYLFMRISQRKRQKRLGYNNFEFWVYYNLVDFYKYEGYPSPEKSAVKMMDIIIIHKNKECQTKEYMN